MKSNDRFKWAADVMDINSKDHILEVGCGVGFAVEAILPLLDTGTITAIDKSPTAINRAILRNKNGIALKKVRFLQLELLHLPKQSHKYNKILCFNINFFWTNDSIARESQVIKSILARRGQLYICYGPLIRTDWQKMANTISASLTREKFKVGDIAYSDTLNCFYVSATL